MSPDLPRQSVLRCTLLLHLVPTSIRLDAECDALIVSEALKLTGARSENLSAFLATCNSRTGLLMP